MRRFSFDDNCASEVKDLTYLFSEFYVIEEKEKVSNGIRIKRYSSEFPQQNSMSCPPIILVRELLRFMRFIKPSLRMLAEVMLRVVVGEEHKMKLQVLRYYIRRFDRHVKRYNFKII